MARIAPSPPPRARTADAAGSNGARCCRTLQAPGAHGSPTSSESSASRRFPGPYVSGGIRRPGLNPGRLRPIEPSMPAKPAGPLLFLVPESFPFPRKCRRTPSRAETGPSRTTAWGMTGMTKRSDQQIALGRRPALATASRRLGWTSRIDRLYPDRT